MATWARIKFFWSTMLGAAGSTLTAGSTASGYSVASIYNMLEINSWQAANTTSPVNINLDLGVGNTATADYFAIVGHNLFTIGAKVSLWASNDNFSADIRQAGSYVIPATDSALVHEFTAPTASRYWRLVVEKNGGGSFSAAPYLTICIWGLKTELDYASASFDPHGYDEQANISQSYGGYVAGVHTQFIERGFTLSFLDIDSTLYAKLASWYDTHGLKNFFVAWETANSPADIYLMRRTPGRNNPLTRGGAVRDATISLKGRKE